MKFFFATLFIALLAACSGAPEAPRFKLTDVTGVGFGRELNLTDHNGRARTLADFRGKVVTVFFGFTHCPDVCPTTLAEMAQVVKALGADGDKVQVLFVTWTRSATPPSAQQSCPRSSRLSRAHGDPDATARAAKIQGVLPETPVKDGSYGVTRRGTSSSTAGPAPPVRSIRAGGDGDAPRYPAVARRR